MKKTIVTMTIILALMLSLAGCGKAPAAESSTPAPAPQATETVQTPAENTPAETPAPVETPAPTAEPAPARQDGERFEGTFCYQGFEETVHYEHLRREDLGFEMDYDYDMFVRQSGADYERFVHVWDDPANPANYIEVEADTGNANLVADAMNAALSGEFDTTVVYRDMDNGEQCICIEASVIKGTNQMADRIEERYIIPAPDGCRIATARYDTVDSEGLAKRLFHMVKTIAAFDRGIEGELSDQMALELIARHCMEQNPDLEEIVNAGQYDAYWEIVSSDPQEVVILFRSYTGAQVRYYVDRATGDVHVTEFVPGITPEEMPSEESLNVWDYVG